MMQDIVVMDKHELVTRGLYSSIRHPAYTGILMIDLGAALIFFHDNAAVVGDYILKWLNEFSETHELIRDVNVKGLFIGIEVVKDHKTKNLATKEAHQVVTEAFQRGAIIQTTGTFHQVLCLVPPLILTKDEGETGLNILEESLKTVERNL